MDSGLGPAGRVCVFACVMVGARAPKCEYVRVCVSEGGREREKEKVRESVLL